MLQLIDNLANQLKPRYVKVYYAVFFFMVLMSQASTLEMRAPVERWVALLQDAVGLCAIIVLCGVIVIRYGAHNYKQLLVIGILLLFGALLKMTTGSSTLLYIVLLSSASEGADVSSLGKTVVLSTAIILSIGILLWFSGLTPDASIHDDRAILGMRYAMGFSHPNRFGMLLVCLGAGVLVGGCRKRTLLNLVLGILVAVAIIIADSRTSALALVIMLVGSLLSSRDTFRHLKKGALFILVCLLLFFACVAFAAIFYDASSPFWQTIDTFFSKRLLFWHEYYLVFGFQLFGSNLATDSVVVNGYNAVLDGAYISSLVQFGIIGTILIIFGVAALAHKTVEKVNGQHILIILFAFLVVGITESYPLSPLSNFLLATIPVYGSRIQGRDLEQIDEYGA